MKYVKKLIALIVILCNVLVVGCGLSTGSPQEIEKFNAYIEFSNFETGWFAQVVNSYFKTFGVEDTLPVDKELLKEFTIGDTEGESSMYELYKNRTQRVRKYQVAKPSYGEVDEKMLAYCDQFDVVLELYAKDINTYYTNKEYEIDQFKKGQELHIKMIEEYMKLIDIGEEFLQAFSPQIFEAERTDVSRLKEQGAEITAYALELVIKSKEINNMFEHLSSQGIDFIDGDLSAYQKLYEEWITIFNNLTEISQDTAQLEIEGFEMVKLGFLDQFKRTAESMKVAATDLFTMMENGIQDIPDRRKGQVTTGGRYNPASDFAWKLEGLIVDYNKMIK